MRTIAIVNQKGGCGKTTTAVNLGGVLANTGHRTLLVDLDPQSHCAVGLGIPENKIEYQIGDAMLSVDDAGAPRFDDAKLLWRVGRNLELAPSTLKLASLESARGGLADADGRDQRLAAVLARFADRYDWCLIDCPPSIGLLTYNALRAADEAIIPVETSFFAMKGADRQVKTIKSLARRLGGQTPYRVLATMHDPTSRLAIELLAQLEKQFGERLITTVIRMDPKLKEAAALGRPLIEHDGESIGAQDYTALARSLILGVPEGERPRAAGAIEPDDTRRPPEHDLLRPAAELQGKPTGGVGDGEMPASRAAELAMRARRLLDRVADVQRAMVCAAPTAAPEARPSADSARVGTRVVQLPDGRPRQTMEPRVARVYGARETSQGVLFVHPAGPLSRVHIAGDFNNWSPAETPMRFNAALGVHEACLHLPVGRREYRLVVDGRWITDPYNRTTITNPFGEQNSVVYVSRAPQGAMVCEGAD